MPDLFQKSNNQPKEDVKIPDKPVIMIFYLNSTLLFTRKFYVTRKMMPIIATVRYNRGLILLKSYFQMMKR